MRAMRVVKRAFRRAGLRRERVAAARMCCERTVMARLSFAQPGQRSRILCYHSVGTPEWGVNDVSPARFRRHIELALESGYRFVPADVIARTGGGPNALAITFDDGLKSVATNAAPILAEYGVPWTVFVVSDWSEGRHAFGDNLILTWDDVIQIASDGASIGSHSVTHPNFAGLDAPAMCGELYESRRLIKARTGLDPTAFAIPFGQSNNWPSAAATAAAEAGYEVVYAQSEQRRPPGTIPRTFVTRFDADTIFRAVLKGRFDGWEEWL